MPTASWDSLPHRRHVGGVGAGPGSSLGAEDPVVGDGDFGSPGGGGEAAIANERERLGVGAERDWAWGCAQLGICFSSLGERKIERQLKVNVNLQI